MLTAFLKAAKYAALNDDQLVIADDHPNIDGAIRRLNEDFARMAQDVSCARCGKSMDEQPYQCAACGHDMLCRDCLEQHLKRDCFGPPVPPTVAEQERFDAGREYPKFDEAFGA